MFFPDLPVVKLELGANLDASKVVEGSDRVSRRAAGAYVCSARNALGEGSSDKLMLDVKYKPSAVKACEITNVTYDSLTLNCTPGHDGGIRQSFLLEVVDMSTGVHLANVSSDEPEFQVSVGVIAATTAVSATVFCCRHCNKKNSKNEKDKRQQDETSNIPLTGTKESDSVDSLVEYRVRPTYQPNMPMANLGPSIQSLGPMSSLGVPNVGQDCHRPPYDKLPAEQLMPPELYATPPPSLYSNPRNPLNLAQMPELEHRFHMEPRLTMDSRSCSNSPPVRFNTDNSNSMAQKPNDPKQSATKSTDMSLEPVKMGSQECG
ncbi:hypothetical protein MSG28_015743 [Choristoneura fumiferana]|uniref:Uncharacterized protein n=1 Tax=Choristoneura fumiferana TaxID=7141 RepID=A0ACC0KBC9_CHOFU|nr:hypothetical protein MSG28_015743 [Choristoneura fumiferana]